jgi:iron-sulfur cluster assembly accessory protein
MPSGRIEPRAEAKRYNQIAASKEINRMASIAEPVTTLNPTVPPVTLSSQAVAKVREIMATQDPLPAGLRIGVVGGGCSGFQYSMSFENQAGMMDKVFNFEGLKVFVDATSLMYLNGCVIDYVETLEAAGFKFENPNVKSTCGCGSSFSA